MLLRFLLGPCATRQLREREMTMRDERSHAEFVGQVERLAVAISRAKATVVAARCDFSKQVQRPRLAHAVPPLARQR